MNPFNTIILLLLIACIHQVNAFETRNQLRGKRNDATQIRNNHDTQQQQQTRALGSTAACVLMDTDIESVTGSPGSYFACWFLENEMVFPLLDCPINDEIFETLKGIYFASQGTYASSVPVIIDDATVVLDDGPGTDSLQCGDSSTIRIDSSALSRHRRLSEPARFGVLSTLVVYVQSLDSKPSYSQADLSAKMFGSSTDLVNPLSIYNSCSYGSLQLAPAVGIEGGVGNVTLNLTTNGVEANALENLVTQEAEKAYGNPLLSDVYDLVLYCMPEGTVRGGVDLWGSYGYVGFGRSVFDNTMCLYPAFTVHEIGHNLGLGHSGEGSLEYGDGTCFMGGGHSDLSSDEGPLKCFNAAKSWKLGWYFAQSIHITEAVLPWAGKVAAITDLDFATSEEYAVVKFGSDIYFSFNRAKGMNKGTQEKSDTLVIVQESEGKGQSSSLLAALNFLNPTFTMAWGNEYVVFEYCYMTIGAVGAAADFMRVSVHLLGNHSSTCFGPLSAPQPTPSPASPPGLTDTSVLPSDPCPLADEFRFTLQLWTDPFPQETHWRFSNLDETLTRNVTAGFYAIPGHFYQYSECFSSVDGYYFDMMDTAQDGLRDPGRYRLYRDGENLWCGGGNFHAMERTYIHPLDICDRITTQDGTKFYPVEVDIFTDHYGQETTYSIAPVEDGNTLGWNRSFSLSNVTGGPLYPDMRDHIYGCVPEDVCFNFTIMDAGGDGMCCDMGTGHWSISYGDEGRFYSQFVGGTAEYAVFGVNCSQNGDSMVSHSGSDYVYNVTKHNQYALDIAMVSASKKNPVYNN